MAIIINDNYGLNAGKPIDSRYFDGLVPWADEIAANAGIVESYRYLGLTINISGTEYWWKDGVTDPDLIEKTTGGGVGTITGATNGLTLTGVSGATVVLGGTLTGTTVIDVGDGDFQVGSTGLTPTFIAVDASGITMSYSGDTSVSLESVAGLTYEGNYRTGFTQYSLPDVGYVTGLTTVYLKLDQTTPQNITGGQPIFNEGLTLQAGVNPSLISGHTKGRMWYDDDYQTISIDVGDETTIQVAQESVRWVYNETGSIIENGSVVYVNGVHSGLGVDTVTVALAIATGDTVSEVLGMATQNIGIGGFGFVTTYGNINDIDTSGSSSQYSGMTTGDKIFLSATVPGGVTNTPPTTPNIEVHIGRLITKDPVEGKLFVAIHPALNLNDLVDVGVPTPALDDVLKYNGLEWVNAPLSTTSAGSGVNFYYASPTINAVTPPAGLSEDGTDGNGIQVATLSRTPVTTGATLVVAGLNGTDTRAFVAWEQDAVITRTTIDSGLWEFYDYVNVSTIVGETYLDHIMYQVVEVTGSTITTTGAGANSRTATISSGQFSGTYFDASATNTEASYLQTPTGIYQITASASTNSVTITVPTGYVNESGVSGNTWNVLFSGSTESIENTVTTLYQTKIVAPAFVVAATDKLGQISYVTASGAYTLSLSYNGTVAASFIISPFITLHNELAGLQGGSGEERYHLTQTQNELVGGITASAGELNKLDGATVSTAEINYLVGTTSAIQTQLNNKVENTLFTGYTATTKPILDATLTGATNIGGGAGEIYSGQTGRTSVFRTIVGSGDTIVSTSGGTLIIYGSSGGTDQYTGESPSAIDVGGIPSGTDISGCSFNQLWEDLLVPELFQTSVGTPSTSAGATFTGIQEIGYCASQTITPAYSAGAITPLYETDNGTTRGGAANNYNYSGPSVSTGWNGQSSCVINPYTVVNGVQTWNVCTRYDEGACIKGSKGTVNPSYPTVCAQDSITPAGSASVTGILPWYWGTNVSGTITSAIITGGTKTVTTVSQSTPITFDGVTEYLWFAAPAGTTSKTKWWVCAANAGDVGGVGQLWAAACTVAVTSGQGCWSGCNFDVYVTCAITTTAAGIPMCLYY